MSNNKQVSNNVAKIVENFASQYVGKNYRIFVTSEYSFITLLEDEELLPPIAYLAFTNNESNELLKKVNHIFPLHKYSGGVCFELGGKENIEKFMNTFEKVEVNTLF